MMNIHELSNHREQRVRDFKRYQSQPTYLFSFYLRSRLEARYRFEERIKHLSPEQQVWFPFRGCYSSYFDIFKEAERKKAADAAKERRRLRHEDAKKRHKGAKLPMSESQVQG